MKTVGIWKTWIYKMINTILKLKRTISAGKVFFLLNSSDEDEESINSNNSTNIQRKNFFKEKLALVIIPKSNNSHINVRNVAEFFIQAVLAVNFTNSLSNLGV